LRKDGPSGLSRAIARRIGLGVWRRSREHQRGVALVNALLLSFVFALMMVAGYNFTKASQSTSRSNKYDAQAYHVARSGLVDAINWFKRQASQPVTEFRPAVNVAVPTKGDTNDPWLIDPGAVGGKLDPSDSGSGPSDKPHLGIVQEFQLDPRQNLWGRYEVGKVTRLDPDSHGKLRNYVLMEKDGSGAWVDRTTISGATSNKWEGVEDVTANYALDGEGLIWRIRSRGYIYRKDPAAPVGARFYQYPNEVLAQVEVQTEIRRLQVTDYQAAIHTNASTTFNNTNKVKIVAPDGYAVKYNGGTIDPAGAPPTFTGTLGSYKNQSPNDSLSWMEMFAVSDGGTLGSMADAYVTDLDQLPRDMSSMALTYINGNAVFDQQRPLNGGGILAVNGNLRLEHGSASTFAGVIYVNGNYFQGSPSAITGQVVVKGTSVVESPSDTANIEYNTSIIGEVRRQLGQYRERRSAQRDVQ
jgi:hypothetical protein